MPCVLKVIPMLTRMRSSSLQNREISFRIISYAQPVSFSMAEPSFRLTQNKRDAHVRTYMPRSCHLDLVGLRHHLVCSVLQIRSVYCLTIAREVSSSRCSQWSSLHRFGQPFCLEGLSDKGYSTIYHSVFAESCSSLSQWGWLLSPSHTNT